MDTLPYLTMFAVMGFPLDLASRTLLEIQSLWHQQFAIKTIIKDAKESCLVENCLLKITALSKIVLLFPCHKPC
jgi:hypothetical protein